jgi:hypothetical protein
VGMPISIFSNHWSYPMGLNCFCCSLHTNPYFMR